MTLTNSAVSSPAASRPQRLYRKRGVLPWHLNLVRLVILVMAAAGVIFPIVIFLGNSLKTDGDFLGNPIGWPTEFAFGNYIEAWQKANMSVLIVNSLVVSLATVAATIILTSMMAYGLVTFRFRGRNVILLSILVMLTIPVQIYIIPLYVIAINLSIVNTRLGVILPYTAAAMPLALVLFRNYFLELPAALSEAARLDGCSRFGIYWRIVMPLSRPAIGAVAIFTFVSAWNEFFLALVFLQNASIQTLPLGMQVFAISEYQTNYPLLFSAITIGMAPMIVIYLLMQRQFISGLAGGAMKG
ncbi:carbohydrate ABC transporter membrane protein 2, CUT1 family [Kaistia soli DSM 19436]|uniref:sn-glycerol-3-phosphate transport system permease protein UgpE n=1 Tax=Kaistia soli DSM 19436 TaxID=1122133 RepID=A0A1M5PDU3_9HYPH|nr:carbohydrate ABC transporter permease [Kaistia soli]SHG99888.1 carbohydrate ABC transporter membrane protein 2, CUT1 family [Kaistia soli DSM 19436]